MQAVERIIFLGPSLARAEARELVEGDFRPPIKRGDLEAIEPGRIVGIIDGVFDHSLSVSPAEIDDALRRGIRILGSSSMGALRAAEVQGMEGVGRVFEMFREGLTDDDEVAIAFDPETFLPLSEPMVNVRHAVDRLVRSGTLKADVGKAIIKAAKGLFYTERAYPYILRKAGLERHKDIDTLLSMLRMHDLKRDDAITLLERLRDATPLHPTEGKKARSTYGPASEDHLTHVQPTAVAPADQSLLLWEYGERVRFTDLVLFLKMTGTFRKYARNAVARFLLEGNELDVDISGGPNPDTLADAKLDEVRNCWGWAGPDESRVTLNDLGIGTEDLWERILEEVKAELTLMALAREASEPFLKALRVELLLHNLNLKRELIRCGSLDVLARQALKRGGLPDERERAWAQDRVCERVNAVNWPVALEVLAPWGVTQGEASAFVDRLALAGREAKWTFRAHPAPRPGSSRRKVNRATNTFALKPTPKVRGSRRFTVPFQRAHALASRVARKLGITRVAMITGLDLTRIPVAQAYRPSGVWSSTIGGGKSDTVLGAKIGAIMEETEKWAQEQYSAGPSQIRETFAALMRKNRRCIDPRSVGLPYDSRYHEHLELDWTECVDLQTNHSILVPSALVEVRRGYNDILVSQRRGGKIFDTNGLASAFTLPEALTHAISELIERHAMKIAEMVIGNPGLASGVPPYLDIDLTTVPDSIRRLIRRIERAGYYVRASDVTSEINVPTFHASILVEKPSPRRTFGGWLFNNAGHAAHPDPEVALKSALLEAVQTVTSLAAGGREDLTTFARSLGRHERTTASSPPGYAFYHRKDWPSKSFHSVAGFVSRDAAEDVRWLLRQLRQAGFRHALAVDYTNPSIRAVRVVRVIVPELETINPFFSGPRARVAMLRDLLPADLSPTSPD